MRRGGPAFGQFNQRLSVGKGHLAEELPSNGRQEFRNA